MVYFYREVNTEIEKLRQVILIEEFKSCVYDDIKGHRKHFENYCH